MTTQTPTLISISDVLPGDVLLCWPATPDFMQRKIQQRTGSSYVHAEIVESVSPARCAEVGLSNGILKRDALKLTPMSDLLARYAHVTVLRHPDAWPATAVLRLQAFVKQMRGKTRYKALKTVNIHKRQAARQANLHHLLQKYFQSGKAPSKAKSAFFCSEFVVECFVKGGYLHESAAVVYCGEDTTPGHLAVDNTFGFVVGYLSDSGGYKIPDDEPLRHQTRYDVLFPLAARTARRSSGSRRRIRQMIGTQTARNAGSPAWRR